MNILEPQKDRGIITSILDKYLGEIKEYAGILTLLITVGATILGALIRFGIYSYYYGFVFYWNLPKEVINIDSNNTFYNIAFYFVISLFIIVLNSVFYRLFSALYKRSKKVYDAVLIIYIALPIICIIAALISLKIGTIIAWFIAVLTICVCPGYIFCDGKMFFQKIRKKLKKNKEKDDEKNYSLKEQVWQCLVILSVLAVLDVVLLLGTGYLSAKSITSFRVVEENSNSSAIIYETSDAYYISPCILENGTIVNIDKGNKTIIGKENINYTHHKYVAK